LSYRPRRRAERLSSLPVGANRAGYPGNTANPNSDAIVLSPFEVNTAKDTGYVAASSLAGGRADTPLELTPASISVMTQEFLEDFNIRDKREAAAWNLNMEGPANPNEGPFAEATSR
jgi:hypothetical protein